jgi:SAM domain (Sterile alpha motif)
MDVASWLRSLGLEQYEAAFRENAITEKLLPSLTAEDLKDLGVSFGGVQCGRCCIANERV